MIVMVLVMLMMVMVVGRGGVCDFNGGGFQVWTCQAF